MNVRVLSFSSINNSRGEDGPSDNYDKRVPSHEQVVGIWHHIRPTFFEYHASDYVDMVPSYQFPAEGGVGRAWSDTEMEKKCYTLSTKVKRCEESLVIDTLNVKGPRSFSIRITSQGSDLDPTRWGRPKSDAPNQIAPLHQATSLDDSSVAKECKCLHLVLTDMYGIDQSVIKHELNVNPDWKLIK